MGLNISIVTVLPNIETLKMIQQNTNVCFAIRLPRSFNTYKFSNRGDNKIILNFL